MSQSIAVSVIQTHPNYTDNKGKPGGDHSARFGVSILLTVERKNLRHGGVAAINGTVWAYETAANAWSTNASWPTARSNLTGDAVKGFLLPVRDAAEASLGEAEKAGVKN